MKVQISDDQIFYPDVMVACDPDDNGEYGTWWPAEVSDKGLVPFPCPEIELSLDQIYEGIDFSNP